MRRIAALTAALSLATVLPTTTEAATGRCTQYESVARRAGWPAHAIGRVSYITWRETRCSPTAYNGRDRDRSYGLMQINTKGALWAEVARRCHLTNRQQLFVPSINLACGHRLYVAYGWRPWGWQ